MNPMPGAIVFAKDIQKLADFYANVFTLQIKHTGQEKLVLESEHFLLVIHRIPEHIAAKLHIPRPPLPRENMAIKLFLPVRSIGDARLLANALGGCIQGESHEWSAANFTACDGYDPEGNIFQVRETRTSCTA